jgi:PIN domain nuclease of toxin-antitoxin system
MRALLDTHTFLWWIAGDARLSSRARTIIADRTNEIYFSAISGWEIAEKARRGKLSLPSDPESFVAEQVVSNAFEVLPLELAHALHVFSLPSHHKDPFDRMLIAQAQLEELKLLSADHQIARYDVEVIW